MSVYERPYTLLYLCICSVSMAFMYLCVMSTMSIKQYVCIVLYVVYCMQCIVCNVCIDTHTHILNTNLMVCLLLWVNEVFRDLGCTFILTHHSI